MKETAGVDPLQVKIEKAKRELEHMIALIPQVMLLVDPDGRISRANKALLELLGLQGGYPAVLGKRLEELFGGNAGVKKLLQRRTGNRELEADIKLPDGQLHPLHFKVVGVGTEGELSVVMVSDVGAEKQHAASMEVRHKTEAVKAVAGALMHNVNQSLTVIMVNAQLLNLMLEKGLMNTVELGNSLNDIVRETTLIAEILKDVGRPDRFVTEPYPGSENILDIKRSAVSSGDGAKGRPQRAYVWLESSCTETVDRLLKALDVHEGGSLMHARVVAEYAVIMSRCLGHGAEDADKIRNCAALHDIGKLGIPDSILRKPAPLSEEETRTMHSHSELGYSLLRNFPFARDEADVARSHHERWDGSGYPQGLAGKEIHPLARIVAVADTFDALCRERAYHEMQTIEAAGAEINAGAGSHFDPDVVKAFNGCLDELKAVARKQAPADR